MNNLKTAVVMVLLIGALYGGYTFLTQRNVPMPADAQWHEAQGLTPPDIEFGSPGVVESGVADAPYTLTAPTIADHEHLHQVSESPARLERDAASPRADRADRAAPPPPSFAVLPAKGDEEAGAAERAVPLAAPAVEMDSRFVPPGEAHVGATAGDYPERPARAETDSLRGKVDTAALKEAVPGLQDNPFYRKGDEPTRPTATDPSEPASPSPQPASRSSTAERQIGRQAFARAWQTAKDHVEAGKFAPALAELTLFYNSPDLSSAEHKQLVKTLDSLAGRVIYSTEHTLEDAYVVRRDDTLMSIAAQYNVPWQLLQNINGIRNPNVLVPRTTLKVVRGPFRAEVGLSTSELTLFVDKYYAGRFPATLGKDPLPEPGTYTVRGKQEGKDYYLADGRTIPARSPANPFGGHWLDLGREVSIHGSAERNTPAELGCISLSPIDAADVFGILSVGSQVTVRR